MTIPGFTAEASVYKVNGRYYTTSLPNQVSRISEGVGLAQWEECDYCRRLTGCARRSCNCECRGGICYGSCCRYCT